MRRARQRAGGSRSPPSRWARAQWLDGAEAEETAAPSRIRSSANGTVAGVWRRVMTEGVAGVERQVETRSKIFAGAEWAGDAADPLRALVS